MLTEIYIEEPCWLMRNWLIRFGRLGMLGEIDDLIACIAWMLIVERPLCPRKQTLGW